jgi:hypothetical protein
MGKKIKLPENPCAICRKREATQLCDFVIYYVWTSHHGNGTLTCDLPMCTECSDQRGSHDFCHQHSQMLKDLDLKDPILVKRRNYHQSKMIRESGY